MKFLNLVSLLIFVNETFMDPPLEELRFQKEYRTLITRCYFCGSPVTIRLEIDLNIIKILPSRCTFCNKGLFVNEDNS